MMFIIGIYLQLNLDMYMHMIVHYLDEKDTSKTYICAKTYMCELPYIATAIYVPCNIDNWTV